MKAIFSCAAAIAVASFSTAFNSAFAQSSAPGSSPTPAITTRMEDVAARARFRAPVVPFIETEPRLSDNPAEIARIKESWRAVERNARYQLSIGQHVQSLFPNDHLEPDLGAVFTDRSAATYESFAGPGQVSSRPSDTHLAVGCTHVGVVTNKQIAFYLKDGTLAFGPVQFADFWPTNPAADDLFDPKIAYDPHENRWIVMAINGRRLASVYWAISISKTADPLGDWWTYFLRADIDGSTDTALWTDFPGLAYDSGNATSSTVSGGGLYIGGNQYTTGDSFQYAKVRVLRKYQVYNGAGASWWDFWDFKNADNSTAFTVKPACMFTATSSPTMYLMNTVSSGTSWVTKRTITNPLASGPSLTGPTQINVTAYSSPPNATQSGGTGLIDTGDCRTQDPWYASGSIYLAHCTAEDWNTPASIEAAARSYRILASTNSVVWTSTFGADTLHYFFPSIAADSQSEAYMVIAVSGTDRFTQIRHTGRQPADGAMQGSSLLKSGEAYYNPSSSDPERWGDYSGIGIDPTGDERGAWMYLQYADTSTTWDTWIGGASFGQPNVHHISSGPEESFAAQERYFTWQIVNDTWASIAIVKNGGAAADDVDISASNSCGFGTPYQSATFGNTLVDFIASNGTFYGDAIHQARAYANSGAIPPYRIETRFVASTISPTNTAATAGSFTATDLIDNFQATVVNGKTYAAVLDITTGTANYDLFRFAANRLNGRRAVNDGQSSSATNGVDETIVYTASASGKDGFCVVNNNGVAGNYTMRLWLKPLVTAIGIVDPCTAAPLSYQMTLVEGTSPTWSFVSGNPAGMTINASTGLISWAVPRTGNYNVTVRATNPAGFDDEALTFRFNCAADFNCDGQVDDADFSLFIVAYNQLTIPPALPKFDLNNDGLVEDADFSIFVGQYNDLICP
ncbi:MAG: putative Ig domain-containing protein [Phycisphaeraceae bacterium]|nr:putative Ig domain-containing protein [Phycisphaeraceae bacterium]